MISVFGIIAPVFTLIVMGAAAVRTKLLDGAAVRGMSDFVFYLALPSLLFSSVAGAPPLRLADVAGAFLAAALVMFAIAVGLSRTALRASLGQAGMFALNAVFGNTVMLGIPIVHAAYGENGVAYLLAIIAFHSAVLLPLTTVLIEADNAAGRGALRTLLASLPGLVRNPVVVAIGLAFAWRATGWAVPTPLHRLLALLGAGGPALALFCLGASLPRSVEWSAASEIVLGSVLKLIALPALAALFAYVFGLTGHAFAVVVIAAALPTGANAFLLARRFSTMMEASAGTVVVSTVSSLITLTALLAWLR